MSDEPTDKEIADLVKGLEKEAREGRGKRKRPPKDRLRRRTGSQIIVSEDTRRVRELEIQALEQKQFKEELRMKLLKAQVKKRENVDETLMDFFEKYLKH